MNSDDSDKIKVLLKSTPSSNLHSVYQELVDHPPVNCVYLRASDNKLSVDRFLGGGMYYLCLPNLSLIGGLGNVDLVHSHQQLILNDVPWVVDFEQAGLFMHAHHLSLKRPWNRWVIRRLLLSDNCKKIMPWSFAAKKSLESMFNTTNLEDKIEVIYPAIHSFKLKKYEQGCVTLLFIGRRFLRKGGIEALKAFKILSGKYDIKLVVVSDVPQEIMRKCENIKNIEFYRNVHRDRLFREFFPRSDIFFFPTFYDTFGMVFLEAMAFGVPIVTLDGFATPEIVEDGKNGFLIKPYSKLWFGKDYLLHPKWGEFDKLKKVLSKSEQERIVNDLVFKTSLLIENDTLRKKMGEYGRSMVESGKFSIKERNKKLERIYREAIE